MAKKVDQGTMDDFRDLVRGMVSKIVDHPDKVEVNIVPSTFRIVAELHTAEDDLGHVIGRNAHLISSIRAIVAAFQGRVGIDCELIYVTDKHMQLARRDAKRLVQNS